MTNKRIASNFVWRTAERFGSQGVTLLTSIVLARLLIPEETGIVAIVGVFINIANIFVTDGLGNALIQKKEADNVDYSSVFFFAIALSTVLYAILFFCAPMIAEFYKTPMLIPILRVLGLRIILAGVNSIQYAYVSVHMQFKKLFFSTLIAAVVSAVVGIGMAYKGMSSWSIVGQYLSFSLVSTVALRLMIDWRVQFVCSRERLIPLIGYGWKLLASSLLDTVVTEVRGMFIAWRYTPTALAYYSQGNTYPQKLVSAVNTSINAVLFSVMSRSQDNLAYVKHMTRKSMKYTSFMTWPVLVIAAAAAPSIVRCVLSEKWMPSVPYLQIACLLYALWPINTANLLAIKVIGRSDVYLKLEIIKKAINILSLLIAIPFGVMAIAMSALISGVFSLLINAYPNRKLIGYTYKEQLVDVGTTLALACISGAVVLGVGLFLSPGWLTLAVQLAAGGGVYLWLTHAFKVEGRQIIGRYIGKVRRKLFKALKKNTKKKDIRARG